jgi:hypothetical protein
LPIHLYPKNLFRRLKTQIWKGFLGGQGGFGGEARLLAALLISFWLILQFVFYTNLRKER